MTHFEDKQGNRFSWALALLAIAMLFGGASQQNALRLALVELASLPMLMVSIYRLGRGDSWRMWAFPISVLAAIVSIPLIQLIPLPPELWRRLPNRENVVIALRLAGVARHWLPITLGPEDTLRNTLALTPPAAMFLAVLCASELQQRTLVSATLVWALFSIVLGIAQAAGGTLSPLYLYDPAHLGLPIGLFSNRNHQAIFMLTALPMVTLWVMEGRGAANRRAPPLLSLVLFSLLIVGVVATRSRAGLILLGPALAGSLALAWKRDRFGVGRRTFGLILGMALIVMLVATQFFLANVLPRFDLNQNPELRFDFWPYVSAAASNYLPLGSGIGTFDLVFRSVEPLALMDNAFFNHAHNEYLEVWLETGWMGVAVGFAFGIWFVRTALDAWRAGRNGQVKSLQRAGTIVVGLLLAHSAVDYPIRTEALATVFALACGLMAIRHGVQLQAIASDGEKYGRHERPTGGMS